MGGTRRHLPGMAKHSPLDDPRISAHAWARYRRLMWVMLGVSVLVMIVSLTVIYLQVGMVSVHYFIAAGLGILITMLLMSALMGLVFLSSGTGHDEVISDIEDESSESWDQDSAGRKR